MSATDYARKIGVIDAKIKLLQAQKAELTHRREAAKAEPIKKRPKPKAPSKKKPLAPKKP